MGPEKDLRPFCCASIPKDGASEQRAALKPGVHGSNSPGDCSIQSRRSYLSCQKPLVFFPPFLTGEMEAAGRPPGALRPKAGKSLACRRGAYYRLRRPRLLRRQVCPPGARSGCNLSFWEGPPTQQNP